ncbi:MAG TPA: phage antirepressor KilAC domain-containing protein [Agriterribacter sp.]|uniref:phage antirepressor KilAC domain-containing protein n=1 Tax=Agriterribacter sp. TaxID=2821509 RepID=UPI002C975D5E|nr:phage antirepressor KilAC domain-containing protein [Agriterribacter sp.]HRQ17726.1 phage antirepressor KilAC domain-containing protein [Agriterribacter sp.]
MEQLIKIETDAAGKRVVSSRGLYDALRLDRSHYSRWVNMNIINNQFAFEGVDWEGFAIVANGNETREFALSLDFAKRLAMMAKSEAGEIVRQYFLECERRAKNPVANISRLDMAKMLLRAEEENVQMREQIEANAPKVLFAESVQASKDCILVKELAAYLTQNGFPVGQNNLYQLLRANGYLCYKGAYYNLPSQRSLELGLFEVRKTAINKPDGTILMNTTTLVTGKGQVYFLNWFRKRESQLTQTA